MIESPAEPPDVVPINAVTARVSGYNIAARVTTAVTMTGGRHIFAILAGIVIARGLGPTSFGNFMFLLAGFTTLHTLLDLSSSQGFFTLICKRVWSFRLYAVYGTWIAAQFVLPVIVIGLIFPDVWVASVWRGQSREIVLVAFVASFAQRVFWQLVMQLHESRRLTIRVQLATVGIVAAHFLLALVLRRFGGLTPTVLFVAIALEFSVTGTAMLFLLGRRGQTKPDREAIREVLRELLIFAAPLAPSLLLQSLNSFGETWLLQIFGGAREQAFFSVAQQYANIGLVFGFSATNVFWKEIAAAQERGDVAGMRRIYISSTRVLFLSAAVMVGFVIFWSSALMRLVLGEAYVPAGPDFAVTLFTSISQCFGIVVSVIYLATSRTKTWSILQMLYVVVGIPGSILFLWILKMGALGLALKLAFMSTASILLYDWYISRLLGWKTDNLFRLAAGGFLFGAGLVSHFLTLRVGVHWAPVFQIAASLGLYLAMVVPAGLYGMYRMGYLVHLKKLLGKLD
jgi:O-antigen/teichoic acid export membrane protein